MGFSLYYKCFVVAGFTLAHNDTQIYLVADLEVQNYQISNNLNRNKNVK